MLRSLNLIYNIISSSRVEQHVKPFDYYKPDRAAAREQIHSETVLNICRIDGSKIVTGSQDRVRILFSYIELS